MRTPPASLLHALVRNYEANKGPASQPLPDYLHHHLNVCEKVEDALQAVADKRIEIEDRYAKRLKQNDDNKKAVQQQCPHYDVDSGGGSVGGQGLEFIPPRCRVCGADLG